MRLASRAPRAPPTAARAAGRRRAPSSWGSRPGRTLVAGGGSARRRGTSYRSGRRRPTRGPAPAASRSSTTPSLARSRRSTPSSSTPSTSASKLVCNITGDTINKSEEHIWKHINGKRFLNKLEKLEEQMVSGEMANEETAKSNEVAKKSKSSKKDKKGKKKTNVASPLPREHKPEMDDSDDPDFWVPPVGSRWDDDDGKDRWESSSWRNDSAKTEGGSDGGGCDTDDGKDKDMAYKDDAESRELASSRTKRMSLEVVGPSSLASRKKKPKKDQ